MDGALRVQSATEAVGKGLQLLNAKVLDSVDPKLQEDAPDMKVAPVHSSPPPPQLTVFWRPSFQLTAGASGLAVCVTAAPPVRPGSPHHERPSKG